MKFNYPFSKSYFLACLLPLINVAYAQQPPDQVEPQVTELPALRLDVNQSPLSQSIDMRKAQTSLAHDLDGLFVGEPSVQVGTGGRNSQKIFLRGIEDLHLNIQMDGARQGANLFHHQGRLQADPSMLKAVEVNAGPAAADAGAGALGGSVRFETVDAQDLLQDDARFGGRLGLQYESGSDLFGGLLSTYGRVTEHLGLLAYARLEDNNKFRAGGGERMTSTDGSRENYLFKASLLDLNGHNLRLSMQRNVNEGGWLRGNVPWLTGNEGQKADEQKMSTDNYTLNYQYRPAHMPLIDFRSTLYFSDATLDLDNFSNLPAEFRTKTYGGDVRNIWRFKTAAVEHELSTGADYFRDNNSYTNALTQAKEYAWNVGLYVQNRMSWKNLRLSAGLRQDHYKAMYDGQYKSSDNKLSPNVSMEWDLLSGPTAMTLFAGYGESVRGTRLNQAGWLTKYCQGPGQPDMYCTGEFTLGDNGKQDPERAIQQEVGVRLGQSGLLAAGDEAGIDIRYYDLRIKDYLITPGEGGVGRTDRLYNAAGDITSRGYEVRAYWSWEQWAVQLAYNNNDVRNYDGRPMDTTGSSARVGSASGDRLSLDIQWQPNEHWLLGYGLTVAKRLKDVPEGNPQKPGYAVHDLRARWMPYGENKRVVLTLALDNVFDKRYAEHTTVRRYYMGQEVANWETGRNLKLGVDFYY